MSRRHIFDAFEAARAVTDFAVGKSEADLRNDLLLRSAVERQLEALGESLNRLRRQEYGQIDYGIVWAAMKRRVPGLTDALDALLPEVGPPPDLPES